MMNSSFSLHRQSLKGENEKQITHTCDPQNPTHFADDLPLPSFKMGGLPPPFSLSSSISSSSAMMTTPEYPYVDFQSEFNRQDNKNDFFWLTMNAKRQFIDTKINKKNADDTIPNGYSANSVSISKLNNININIKKGNYINKKQKKMASFFNSPKPSRGDDFKNLPLPLLSPDEELIIEPLKANESNMSNESPKLDTRTRIFNGLVMPSGLVLKFNSKNFRRISISSSYEEKSNYSDEDEKYENDDKDNYEDYCNNNNINIESKINDKKNEIKKMTGLPLPPISEEMRSGNNFHPLLQLSTFDTEPLPPPTEEYITSFRIRDDQKRIQKMSDFRLDDDSAEKVYTGTNQNHLHGLRGHLFVEREISLFKKCNKCHEKCQETFHFTCGNYYHPECLKCAICSQSLKPPKCVMHQGELLCQNCGHCSKELTKCQICKQFILDFDEKIKPKGFSKFIHASCFTCFECSRLLTKKSDYKTISRSPICSDCIPIIQKRVCSECMRPIVGRYVKNRGKFFHIDHFKCCKCDCVLFGNNYIVHHNKFYCPIDGNIFSKTCAYCKTDVSDKNKYIPNVEFHNKIFHGRCFVCRICGERCNPGTCMSFHGRPHCKQCYEQRVYENRNSEIIKNSAENKNHVHKPAVSKERRNRFALIMDNKFIKSPIYKTKTKKKKSRRNRNAKDRHQRSQHSSSHPSTQNDQSIQSDQNTSSNLQQEQILNNSSFECTIDKKEAIHTIDATTTTDVTTKTTDATTTFSNGSESKSSEALNPDDLIVIGQGRDIQHRKSYRHKRRKNTFAVKEKTKWT